LKQTFVDKVQNTDILLEAPTVPTKATPQPQKCHCTRKTPLFSLLTSFSTTTAIMGDALLHLANRTKLEWTCNLNTEYTPKRNYRRTSIICTIGESKHNYTRELRD
jgi:hypothetical protein